MFFFLYFMFSKFSKILLLFQNLLQCLFIFPIFFLLYIYNCLFFCFCSIFNFFFLYVFLSYSSYLFIYSLFLFYDYLLFSRHFQISGYNVIICFYHKSNYFYQLPIRVCLIIYHWLVLTLCIFYLFILFFNRLEKCDRLL